MCSLVWELAKYFIPSKPFLRKESKSRCFGWFWFPSVSFRFEMLNKTLVGRKGLSKFVVNHERGSTNSAQNNSRNLSESSKSNARDPETFFIRAVNLELCFVEIWIAMRRKMTKVAPLRGPHVLGLVLWNFLLLSLRKHGSVSILREKNIR